MQRSVSLAVKAAFFLLIITAASVLLLVQGEPFYWVPPGASRCVLAAVAVTGYGVLCARAYQRHRPRRAHMRSEDLLLVAYASQTGQAEALAERTADALRAAGLSVQQAALADIDRHTLVMTRRALFIVSTTGEGDAPDTASAFFARVAPALPRLDSLEYGLLALGDRSYRHFCGFGRRFDSWLQARGAQSLFPRIEVDRGDVAALARWWHQIEVLAPTGIAAQPNPTWTAWTLLERRLLNDGSIGRPAFHLELAPPLDEVAHWRAGDLVEIRIPGNGGSIVREYSIGSIPADGRLHLLVRQMCLRQPDGSVQLGVGSGWLTRTLEVGQSVELRIRRNKSFHGPADDRPMILIGNGTGLAGLRAHLRERQMQGRYRNWLIFGERQAAHDAFYRDELEAMHAAGAITRIDWVFSRDTPRRCYVQDRLREHADLLREWIEAGAAIYVSGSQKGMVPGVNAALLEVLGASALERLNAEARYRRDVY
ncbi:sulfite reductase (NADPH) flavoprotein alpha-component [Fontimonas thermophila]|uniref:NADPH--hemoprotein reductase n=1 Tax=Fontimonas thermophila TaxID=1076937 RepID=A0A1I2ICP4_9GAMM|nr:sulfite reductase subunit alpha [Fontimonas thermophila]SFF40122.1 sulfite reductase (NADPH) flavoprotein alpha-component [Fontimonas thermophila]